MRPFSKTCSLVWLFLFFSQCSFGQVFFNTHDILHNTHEYRKNQTVHSIQSVYEEDGNVIINFTATLSKKEKQKSYHLVLPFEQAFPYYEDKANFFHEFDSAFAAKTHIKDIGRRYKNISGKKFSHGFDIECYKEIVKPGFYQGKTPALPDGAVMIIDDQESELFPINQHDRVYMKGKHIVLLYYLPRPKQAGKASVEYIVINVENSPQIKKSRYLKLPLAMIFDTILAPFTLMMQGMEK